ncbi:nucleotidyltransferase domain-containing protein [Candidatus Pacearchaeota archaeon]|nr:nucleotidyltransferase domain-containing protein [Candidatus Pacearchaeota archaeon]
MILNKKILHDSGCFDKDWIVDNMQYETIVGSYAYGCNVEESDFDIYAYTIPPKEFLVPNFYGYFYGFDKIIPSFDQYATNKKFKYKKMEAEGTVYNIVKYFRLIMENNPNMLDTLFTRNHLHTHNTNIGKIVIENRKLFVSKKSYHTFRGYASKQRENMIERNPSGKRKEIVDKFGYDVKYAAHLIRLLLECEQLLETGEMDLMRDKEILKSIRRGEWSSEKILDFFDRYEPRLDKLYESSKIQYEPDTKKIKDLLIWCLEEYYGDLRLTKNSNIADILNKIQDKLSETMKIVSYYKE